MATRYWLIAGAIAIAVIAGVMLFSGSEPEPEPQPTQPPTPAEPEPAPEPQPEPEPEPAPEPAPAPEAEPEPELPPLSESDAFVRDHAEEIAAVDAIERWLATEQLVRKAAVVVENVAQGRVPREALSFLAPEEKFTAVERNGALYIDPDSYDRYDDVAKAIGAVDARGALAVLRRLDPLLTEAYAELGIQEVDPDRRLADAIEVLLATPAVEGPIRLERPSVAYEFADSSLEALPPVQKQLIRMGPENMRKVKRKLREMQRLLTTE